MEKVGRNILTLFALLALLPFVIILSILEYAMGVNGEV